ncbi:hypothetical protein LSM04_003221 [Trypanosoma melophagium]|nr:hypothetical protein LSM04_003221 [Trypanosoma melophagium]
MSRSSPTNDSVLNFLNEYANEKDESALFLAFSELLVLCDWDFINVETNAPRFMAFVKKMNINGCQDKSNRGTTSQKDSNCLGSSLSNSFARYFCSFVDLWKQCLVKFPSGQEWTLQSLCTRMVFLLKEFFLMGTKAFGVSSIDILLHRVVLTKNNYKDSHATGLSQSRSHTTDLCSLHSCTESACDKHRLSEESVVLFQHLFESLVITPFMLLFQSSKTPLSLWSKILALIAALLSFHKQNHGYVTDLLLKFRPYLERGLNVDSTRNSVVDETPLFERFAVLFLADEVSEKLRSLKIPVHTKVPVRIGCDSRKQPPSLVSLVDDENLIAALIEYIVKDSFSVHSTKGAARSVSSQSLIDQSPVQASLHTEEGGSVLPLIINVNKETSHDNDTGKEWQTAECEQLQTPSSVELESSSLCVKKKSTFLTPFLSHRFGEYVYEVCPGINGGVEMLDQLPLECYRRPLLQRETGHLLDVAISPENNSANSEGEGEEINTHEHKPLATRARLFYSDVNQGFIPRDENRVFPLRQHERTATSLSTLDGGEFSDTDSDYLDS